MILNLDVCVVFSAGLWTSREYCQWNSTYVRSLHLPMEKVLATAVMWDIFSMDHHGEHVNLMVPGVDSNLPVNVSATFNEIM